MDNQTELRLPENIALTSELSNRLIGILGPIKVQSYNLNHDLKRSYERRINTLHEALEFIVEAIPLNIQAEEIQKYLAWCKDYCALPNTGTVLQYQSLLLQYTTLLVNLLVDYYPWENNESEDSSTPPREPDFTLAIEILNKAEQYLLMKKGRNNLATLIPLRVSGTFEWVLLWEKQLPPYTEETLQELKTIGVMSPPFKTPEWFRKLSPPLQMYLHEMQFNISDLIEILSQFSLQWSLIKQKKDELITHGLKVCKQETLLSEKSYLEENHKKLLNIFAEFSLTVNEIDTLLQTSSVALFNLNQHSSSQLRMTFEKELVRTRKLPYWFLLLDEYEQRFLESVLKKRAEKDELVSFLPSRLRKLPMVANLCEHHLCLLSKNGEITKTFSPRLRSSHLASRDIVSLPEPIRKTHVQRNLTKILSFLTKNQPILLQTLISPLNLGMNILRDLTPDYTLEKQLKKIVQVIQKKYENSIFLTNHPLNIVRKISFTASMDPACNELLNYGRRTAEITKNEANKFLKNPLLNQTPLSENNFLEKYQDNIPIEKKNLKDLTELLNEYYNVLNSPYGSATISDHHGRELFLSSLEHLIIMHLNGKSYGSCVSGKDRKQIEILHTDAMLVYREKYGCWASFGDNAQKRTQLVNLVTALYISRHIHEHAGQNAPGADGIKTPSKYWPKDIAEAIQKQLKSQEYLTIDNKLATNNEISRIGKIMLHIKPGFALCLNAAYRLSQESIKKVLDALTVLSQEHSFWEKQRWGLFGSPAGISSIKKLLQTQIKELPSHERPSYKAQFPYKLAEIYFALANRPKNCLSRGQYTQIVYTAILRLYSSQYPETEIPNVLTILDRTKKDAYYYNMQRNPAEKNDLGETSQRNSP